MFTDFFIKRPVFAVSLSLLLLTIGLIAFKQLSLRQYPKMEANVISISTTYSGASAAIVESFVTTKIENAISGVDDIDYITSSSRDGKSKVIVNLVLDADVNAALENISSDLASVLKSLPEGVEDPVVKKVDPDAAPTFVVVFASMEKTTEQITDYLTRVVVPPLTTVSGVGSVDIMGDRTYAMRLWLDPRKMAALGVTADEVSDALNDNNIQAQAGEIDRQHQVLSINAKTDLNTVKEFNDVVVKSTHDQLVRISDIGQAELGAQAYNQSLLMNGKRGVGVGISVKASANPLSVSADVQAVLSGLAKQMPSDVSMVYARDSSTYIKNSMTEVVKTIIEATLFVLMVIVVFLGSLRLVMIPVVAIPLSLIAAFSLLFLLNYSINTLTLLAFVLAIGMVVDDAIVVLENIHRHIELGKTPLEASLAGAREIVFAVIAMTFTLAAVFAPIGFTSGFTSILFKEFAFTLAGTVIISGFVALTLSPMMCAKLMKPRQEIKGLVKYTDAVFHRLNQCYASALTRVLEQRTNVLIVLGGVVILGLVFFQPLQRQSTLAPSEDQGMLMGMASAQAGASLAYTEQYTQQLTHFYQRIPEIVSYVIINGAGGQHKAMTFISLKPWSERNVSAQTIQQSLMQASSDIPGMTFMFMSPSSIPGSTGTYPLEMVIKTTGSYEELNKISGDMADQLEALPGFLKVQSDLKINNPQLHIEINRSRAALLGISMADIGTALNIALGAPNTTSFVMSGQSYNVIPQVAAAFRNHPDALYDINVKTANDVLIPLSTLMTIKEVVMPSDLHHFQQQRAATLNMVLAEGFSQHEAIETFEHIAKALFPANVTYDFSGDARRFIAANSSMLQIFFFALLFIYLVLSAQFESFRAPLIVMFTVPLSFTGALATLYIVGGSLNIYTEIGLITLVGLISKHGILMVEFANQLQRQGRSRKAAIIEASAIRLRPILMTTAAMVLGAFSLVLASGAGAVSRSQMGWTIVGGMTFGTVLTLFVIPTMYLLLGKYEKMD